MSPPSVQETEEEQWVNKSGVEVWSVNVEHTISFEWWWWSAPEFSVLRKWSSLWNQAFIISHHTWNVFGNKWLGNLNFTCIQSDIFLSSSVNISELRSLLFKFNIENRMLVSEVQWCSVFCFELWKILSSHYYFNIYISLGIIDFTNQSPINVHFIYLYHFTFFIITVLYW